MTRKKLTIGLFGFGCVGGGLFEVLEKTPRLKAGIKKICVKDKNKSRNPDKSYFTYDKNVILDDPEINVVVELIDDADAAFEIVSDALKKGKHVVTANKKMVAEHFEELLALQRENNVSLLYEGACCASIPVIRNLEEYYDTDLLESIEGIVNGSTNYILTNVRAKNISYDAALKEAQLHGFAESDPLLDTGGYDARYKLVILLAHAFGLVTDPEHIFRQGINDISGVEQDYAREKGYRIRLVASARKTREGKIIAMVAPAFVAPGDPLFDVEDVFNGVKIRSSFSDSQFFTGRGAGSLPTASAVLSDLSALSYDYRYEYKKLDNTLTLQSAGNTCLRIFARYNSHDAATVRSYFENIEETCLKSDTGFSVGLITLENLMHILAEAPSSSFILFEVIRRDLISLSPKVSLKRVFEEVNAVLVG